MYCIVQIKSNLSFILAVVRRSVKRVCGAHLRVTAPGQHSSFRRNVAAVASCWQHCVRFDRPEIRTSDLPLQRRTRYRSTNWPVYCIVDNLNCIGLCAIDFLILSSQSNKKVSEQCIIGNKHPPFFLTEAA